MRVGILGAGSMGHGIAQVCAMADHEVILRDVDDHLVSDGIDAIEENLQEGIDRGKITEEEKKEALARIRGTTDINEAAKRADLIIEAVPEDPEIKKEVYGEVEQATDSSTIIATNTSSLSVTDLASSLDHPERFIGLHFFNPPHLMDLVEVVVAEQTGSVVQQEAVDFVREIGKDDIVVEDSAGFATSRLGIALGLEAIRMVEQGVATPSDIDQAMKQGYGHPLGPIELTDHVGLDVRLDVAENLREELGERFRPPQLLKRKVRAGHLGKKSGKGFYLWEGDERIGINGDWGDSDE